MRFFGRLLWALLGGSGKPGFSRRSRLEDDLREKIQFWQHQASLYEQLGLLHASRRCREIAQQYRARLVAWVSRSEAA